MKINLDTFAATFGPPDFVEIRLYKPSVVLTNANVGYMIGGVYYPYSDGFFKFNPENFQHEYIFVDNFPISGRDAGWASAPTMVFVEKLNRIYCFGGFSFNDGVATFHETIFHIGLGDVVPTTTTTPVPTITTTTVRTTTIPIDPVVTCRDRPDGKRFLYGYYVEK
jgi:hypothetical protein